jgi:hypothetical protein
MEVKIEFTGCCCLALMYACLSASLRYRIDYSPFATRKVVVMVVRLHEEDGCRGCFNFREGYSEKG